MATPSTAQQINELPEKALLYKVQGRIKAIYPPHCGTNARGEYSIQKGTITIGGVDVGLFIKDREEIPKSATGKTIIFECVQGGKGWSGVYTMDDNYKDKITRLVNVTASAIISYGDPSEAAAPPQRQQAPPQRPATQRQAPPSDEPPHDAYEDTEPTREPAREREPAAPRDPMKEMLAAIAEADDYATQIANLQLLCLIKIDHYVAPRFQEKTGKVLSEAERASLAMNLIIEMMRNGMARKLPRQEAKTKPAAGQ